MKRETIGLLYAIAAGCIWSSIGAAVKIGIAFEGEVIWLGTLRMLFASLPLIALGRVKRFFKLEFVALGALIFAPFQIAYLQAIHEVGIATAVLLLYTSPVWVIVFSNVFFKEIISTSKVLSLVLALTGVLFLSEVLEEGKFGNPLGFTLGALSGFLYALMIIYGKCLTGRGFTPMDISSSSPFWAFLALLPISLSSIKLSLGIWIGVAAYLGLITVTLAYYLLYKSVEMTEVSKVGIVTLVEPVLGVAIGVLAFNEALTTYKVLGSLLIFSSLVIVTGPTIMRGGYPKRNA